MSFQAELALFLSAGAVCTDLVLEKVPNEWIWLGLGAGICSHISLYGARGFPGFLWGVILPVILLFPLFLFRMMGAGDIKLFAALGGLIGGGDIIKGMICSFILGAILSAAFFISCGNLGGRLEYFVSYWRNCRLENRIIPYRKPGNQVENMHFTVPILLGIMLYAGGFY